MVQFKSSAGNSNIFIVNRSELKGRWEPLFYSEKYQKVIDKINSSPWIVKSVKQLAKRIADGPFGSDLKVDEYQVSGVPLLRVSNIRTGEIDGKLVYISAGKNEKLKRSKVYPYDVVLTKAGAILGYSAVFPMHLIEGNITSHLVTISCSEEINPYYLSLFFKSEMGQSQIYQWGNKSTRPELNTGEVKKILVPVPPLDIQKEIVEKNFSALEIRNIKLAKAREKLSAIDTYLLDRLEIFLPEKKETIEDRVFIVSSQTITGKRLDPNAYKVQVQNLKKSIINSSFPKKILKQLVSKGSGGSWGADIVSDFDNEKFVCCTVIRATEFDNKGNLRFIDGKVKQRLIEKKTFEKLELKLDDLIVEKSGGSENQPVGRIAIIDQLAANHSPLIHSNFVHKFSVISDEIIPTYLFYYLNLMHKIKLTESMQSQTNGIRNLIMSEYFWQDIIVPPLDVQKEVVEHIEQLRDEAKKLEDEANLVLENAKQEIEKMILGETV